MMKNGVIYSRVSTEEQAKEGQSIEAQVMMCRKYASENEIKITEVFVDRGKSATNMHRPALQDMLVKCQDKSSLIDIILIQDTDRLARNTLDHLTIKAILAKQNIKLVAISQPMLDSSPEGNLIDTILAATNAFQSQITGRKTSKIMQQKAEAGWYPGGRPPIGYRNAENPSPTSNIDKKIIVIDDSVAPFVKEAFLMYSTGIISIAEIVSFLKEKGIVSPTKGGIHKSLVCRMLQDTFYIGRFYWAGNDYSGKHSKLIDKPLFDKVQEIIGNRNHHASRKRKHLMLLRGYLFYKPSGKQMWGEIKTKDGTKYAFYYCSLMRKGSYATAEKLEGQVEKLFAKIQITTNYREEILKIAKEIVQESRDTKESERHGLLKEKAKYQKAISDAEDDRYIRNIITSEDFLRISEKYRPLLDNIDNQLSKLDTDYSGKLKSLEGILRLAENIGSAYKEADDHLKREYLKLFFERLEVKDGKIVKYYLTPDLNDLISAGSVRVRSKRLPD